MDGSLKNFFLRLPSASLRGAVQKVVGDKKKLENFCFEKTSFVHEEKQAWNARKGKNEDIDTVFLFA